MEPLNNKAYISILKESNAALTDYVVKQRELIELLQKSLDEAEESRKFYKKKARRWKNKWLALKYHYETKNGEQF